MSRRGLVSLTARREVSRRAGEMATAATPRIDEQHEWYRDLSAQERSWVAQVAQAGIANFITWLGGNTSPATDDAFAAAPRALTRAISLAQTLDLVRSVVTVVEEHVEAMARPQDVTAMREAVLRYSREIAFSAAQVYAEAAEERGAWDARLESLVIDSVLRGEVDESMHSRAAALGWGRITDVVVLVGDAPAPARQPSERASPQVTGAIGSADRLSDPAEIIDQLQRRAAPMGLSILAGVHGARLIVVLGGVLDVLAQVGALAEHLGPGPVVYGPRVDDLDGAVVSAAAALAGHSAAAAWPARPRPCAADDLLAERTLIGDDWARVALVDRVCSPLAEHPSLKETAAAFLDARGGLEGTARALYVHVNTVRYRLGRIADVTGFDLSDPHDAFTVRVALALGELLEDSSIIGP